jgi:hypothetical protein
MFFVRKFKHLFNQTKFFFALRKDFSGEKHLPVLIAKFNKFFFTILNNPYNFNQSLPLQNNEFFYEWTISFSLLFNCDKKISIDIKIDFDNLV